MTTKAKHKVERAAWHNMIHRCHNPDHAAYPNYGARGIFVCDEWRSSFDAFLRDVGPKPSPELSLDRIDNEQGYHPGNVAWRDRKQQQNNRRVKGIQLTINGVTKSVNEWAASSGIHSATLYSRVRSGVTGQALLSPPNPAKQWSR